MNKNAIWILLSIVIAVISTSFFGYTKLKEPNYYYKVYLEEKELGIIKSKKALEKYINENGSYYKSKLKTDAIYAPTGLRIEKLTTYSGPTTSVPKVYKKITKKSNFTAKGYEFIITKVIDEEKNKTIKTKINVLDKKIFKESIDTLIKTFVGEEKYKMYLDESQEEIDGTGELVQNVYIDESITVQKKNIPVTKKIFTDSKDLSKYLLYGKDYKESTYEVKAGDTVESVAFENKISPSEVLLSNENLNSESNLLYPGEKLKIALTNPQISVVEEKYTVSDKASAFSTVEEYDDSLILGTEKVVKEGQKGLERVSQEEKVINGEVVYVEPRDKQVLKAPVNKVVKKGSKYVPTVGGLNNWGWPTGSGWMITSGFVYRSNPVTGGHELHTGLDISGTGYGSPIYATNNGVVQGGNYHYSYGICVVINHNNGYKTMYAHMSRKVVSPGQTVEKGQLIGYVGMTGTATGPHVHYEIWSGSDYHYINPSVLYPGGY